MPENVTFTENEIIIIENVLTELLQLIPNDNGAHTEILEKIINAQNIIGAKLDPASTGMAQSGSS